jgi:hypothetical protein
MVGSNSFWFAKTGEFYNGVTSRSAMFHDGDSDHLKFTPDSASSGEDRRKITHSVWIKRTTLGAAQSIYSSTQSGVTDYYLYRFNADDTIDIILDVNDSNWGYITTEKYRDTSSWYHFVLIIDTTQGTNTNRVKLYVNGTLQTLSTKYAGGHVGEDFETYVMDGTEDAIGEFNYNSTTYFDGYMCDFITTVGQDNAIGDFGELKNGVWIPKAYSGSYGANGFRLEFKQTGTGTAGDSTVGADTANNNDWTSSGHPKGNLLDNPENNFNTWDRLANPYGDLFEGNLMMSDNASGGLYYNKGTHLLESGKWYWEVHYEDDPTASNMIGILAPDGVTTSMYAQDANSGYVVYFAWDERGYYYQAGSTPGSKTTYAEGDIISFALDIDSGKLFIRKNDSAWEDSGDPSDGSNPSFTFTAGTPMVTLIGNYKNSIHVANFGQDPTHAGHITAGTATDSNGIGLFKYTPPSGYLAICSSNLAELTIGPNSTTQAKDHFNIVLYSGNDNVQSITGVGFQPDLLWIKKRNGIDSHVWYDSNRGPSSGAKHRLFSNTTAIESDGGVTVFGADGFTVDGAYGSSGENNYNYVAWNWKANGGTTSSDTEGDITSTVQANTTSGFSIITYTGNATDGAEIGHGLGEAPKMLIIKRINAVNGWAVYHSSLAANQEMYLNMDQAATASDFWDSTAPTDTVFTVSDSDYVNTAHNYVCYAIAPVKGFSKVGKYVGTGYADGSFVNTGFKPKWIMVKRISGTADNWAIYDSTRDTINVRDSYIYGGIIQAEATFNTALVDFLSNGFKWRGTVNFGNNSSGTYVYLAFAEVPFKYANGVF